MRRYLLVLAWLFALAFSGNSAAAADVLPANAKELAQQRFQEAIQAYEEGRYSAAASLFEAADRLAPHPSTRYNAATSWEQAGEEARAATGYESALALDSLDPKQREIAEQRLEGLRGRLGRVRIPEPLGALVTVDHVQRAPVPASFFLRPGDYELRVEYRGEASTTSAHVSAGQDQEVQLELPAGALPPEAVESTPPAPELPAAPRPVEDAAGLQKTWGWVSVGAGIALSGLAIVIGVRALAARDRFVESGNTNADARAEASDLRLATNVLWGGATAASATGLVLLLTAPTVEF